MQGVDRYPEFCTMPRKPHSAIVDRLRRDLSSLVRESTEIRERCAATAQPDVQPLQSTMHHILKGRAYPGSSGHWFGIFSKFDGDMLSRTGRWRLVSSGYSPFLTEGRARDEYENTL